MSKENSCFVSRASAIAAIILIIITLISLDINVSKFNAHAELSMYGTVEISSGVMILRYDVPLDRPAYDRLDRLSKTYEIYVIDYTIGGKDGL